MRITRCSLPGSKASLIGFAVLTVGCQSNGGGSPFLTEPVGAEALAGSWVLHLPATNNCTPALPAIELHLSVERTWVAGVDNEGDREYLIGTWGRAAQETEDEVLQGWIEPELRRLHLILWQGVHERGSVLKADVIDGRLLEGRLVEPVPAYPGGGFAQPSEGYPGGLVESSCLWNVSGQRRED